jgi:hypothetical protein
MSTADEPAVVAQNENSNAVQAAAAPPAAADAHLDDLLDMLSGATDEQKQKMQQLKDRIVSEKVLEKLSPAMVRAFNTYRAVFLARHLIARKWDVAAALSMIQDAGAWRNSVGIDTEPVFPNPLVHVRGFDMDELVRLRGCGVRDPAANPALEVAVQHMRSCMSEAWHKTDKCGHPIYITRSGLVRVEDLLTRMKSLTRPGQDPGELICQAHIRSNEVGATLVGYANEKIVPKLGDGTRKPNTCITAIFDTHGLSMEHLKLLDLLKVQSELDKKVYAEGLFKCFVVNANAAVRAAWAIMQLWVDARTKEKVIFVSAADTAKVLLEHIDAENLPSFLGGKCECPDRCCPEPGWSPPAAATAEGGAATAAAAASSSAAPALGGTKELAVAAGKAETVELEYAKGDGVIEYCVSLKERDIIFGVRFVSSPESGGDDVVVREKGKIEAGTVVAATYAPPCSGKLILTFDNTASWMRGKALSVLVAKKKE